MDSRVRHPHGRTPVYGAIDLGTNNCRMLMARPTARAFRVVGSFSRIVRLGQGLGATGRLDGAAIDRTVAALAVCAQRLEHRGASRVRSVATEACRRADNRHDFVARVRAETGIEIETITPSEEAELTLVGCHPLVSRRARYALVFDIGGGSTEVMWVDIPRDRPPRLIDLVSLPFGVVTLAEHYGGADLSGTDYAAIGETVFEGLGPFDRVHEIGREVARGRVQLLGTSGTVTTLGAFHLGLSSYSRSRVDGLDIALPDVAAVTARLAAMSCPARADHPCIGPDRADLVVVGCAVLQAICRRWPVRRLRVADRGIREGLLVGMMAADRGPIGGPGLVPAARPGGVGAR